MISISIKYSNLNDISNLVEKLLCIGKKNNIWIFYGEMASGKTTIIKQIVKQLGAIIEASSPSFNIVNEYPTYYNNSIFHMDLYRIKTLDELLDMGFEEYINSGYYVFIEWPEVAEPILKHYSVLKIKLKVHENGNRLMKIFV